MPEKYFFSIEGLLYTCVVVFGLVCGIMMLKDFDLVLKI